MTDYTITFITMETGFIAIVVFLAFRMTKSVGTMREIHHFRLIQLFFVMEAVVQILWALDRAALVSLPFWADWIVSMIYVLAFALCMSEWFRFVAARLRSITSEKFLHSISAVQNVVTAVHIFLIIASRWTQWIFYIDEQGRYVRGQCFWMNAVLCYTHWFLAALLILFSLKRTRRTVSQHLMKMLGISFVPVLGGLLQGIFYNIPFLDLAMTLATLYLFIILQENQVLTDALTGLKNRAQLDHAFEKNLSRVETDPFYIFIADIDHFKQINDTYGHLQGDRVLMLVAEGLKKLGVKYSTLSIYRYGGDEFVLLIDKKDVEDPAAFIAEINAVILKEEKSAEIRFPVQFSVGYYLVKQASDGSRALQKADDMLYRAKKAVRI